MGIKIDVDTEFGVPAKYWNIGGRGEDFRGKGVEVTMFGWASKQARDDGKQPLAVRKVQFVDQDYVAEMSRQDLYTRIKLKQEFIGATDDLTPSSEVFSAIKVNP